MGEEEGMRHEALGIREDFERRVSPAGLTRRGDRSDLPFRRWHQGIASEPPRPRERLLPNTINRRYQQRPQPSYRAAASRRGVEPPSLNGEGSTRPAVG